MQSSALNSDLHICIAGPGLLGGSIALGIQKHLPNASLSIWARREEARQELRDRGFAESQVFADLSESAHGANLLILATPIGVMAHLAKEIVEHAELAEDAVVTDVGSVKGSVVAELEPIFHDRGICFIGSHPMAGSEKTGLEHSDPELLRGARCIITPTGQPDTKVQCVESFWRSLGASTHILTPAEHDRVVARISHLPHAAASAITAAAIGSDTSPIQLSGGGFRDTTRVAAGAPEMWAEILLENQVEVLAALEDLSANVSEILEFLRKRDQKKLAAYLARAKELRDLLAE
tara:strand:+ start:4655 stop:5533 length:879 start_codon:yes stop_codon:yes gene_type:complete